MVVDSTKFLIVNIATSVLDIVSDVLGKSS